MAEKITKNKINEIKNKSVLVVGDNPSENGLSSDQIKKAIVDPVLEVIDEVNRIVDEVNSETGATIDKAEYVSNKIKEWSELNNEHQYPNAQLVKQSLDDKMNFNNIADNLETEEKGKVLDASQGKILNDKINKKVDLIQGNENAYKVAVTNLNGNIYFANKLPKINMPEITIDMLPSGAGIVVEVAEELRADGGNVTGNDLKQRLQMFDELESNVDEKLEEVLEIVDKVDDVLKTEVICKHAIEITGNTGDEHNLAVEDQQMLLNKIQGQSLVVNQLAETSTCTNSNLTDNAEEFRFSVIAYNGEWFILNPTDPWIHITQTNFKLEGIIILPENMQEFRFKHNGLSTDIPFGYITNDDIKYHSNHKMLYSMFVKSCDVTKVNGMNIEDIMLIDLTQMFGAGNEPTTPQEFYSRYGNGYIPYNEGTIVHSQCNLISTGRNIWDEQWQLGFYNINNGEYVLSTDYICSKNYIDIVPNTTYYLKVPTPYGLAILWYDANKNYISYNSHSNSTVISPLNARYGMIYINDSAYGNTYNNDICINVSDSSFNGTYEPYKEEVVVVNKELKEFDFIQDDKKTIASGEVDLGTLNWEYISSYQMFQAVLDVKNIAVTELPNIICSISKYTISRASQVNTDTTKDKVIYTLGNIRIRDLDYGNNVSAFKQSLSGIKLVYELATPTITDLDIAGGYAVYKGGYQIQDGEVPYILTKEYSLSMKSQILANIEIDREQQEQINEIKEKINEAVSTADSAYDLADEASEKTKINEQELGVLENAVSNHTSRIESLHHFMDIISATVDNKADLSDVITKDKIQYGIINGDNIVGFEQTIDLSQFKYWKGIINPSSQTFNITLHYLFDGDVEHETYSFRNPIIEYINGCLLIQGNEAHSTYLLTSKSINIEMDVNSDSDAFSIYWKGEK